ncbi:MAG: GGDEF domain-containing protein [Spirochaetaceae bacterium]|nr:MAG: GGDEF domain-containing protein [Spirochaetaceae bacterium]
MNYNDVTHQEQDPSVLLDTAEETEVDALRKQLAALEEKNKELENLLNQNPYTGLPIRRVFDREYERLIQRSDATFGVAILRLDAAYERIKNTRDRNKILLFQTTRRLLSVAGNNVYQSDRVDEFILLLHASSNGDVAHQIAAEITEVVAERHEGPANDISFGCHIGIALYENGSTDRAEVIGNADIALEEAVRTRSSWHIYTPELGAGYRRKMLIEKMLTGAVRSGFEQFRILYQPFVDRDGRICGSEALIRWNPPDLGSIGPGAFIPIAEETGDIRFIGQWILYNSCRRLAQWHAQGYTNLYVSVNVAPTQFAQDDLVERVVGILDSLKLPGSCLKLELTEGAIMVKPEEAVTKMHALRERGIRISVDDFGTGYSSLSYLQRLPIDTLKIDRSFIDDVDTNPENQEIVRAIISMAHNLHLETLAEGVEREGQLQFLWNEGCEFIQGFYFSKPVSEHTFTNYLRSGSVLPQPNTPGDSPMLAGPVL